MSKVLVSASHFDTLCQDAWKLFEENGIDVVFDRRKNSRLTQRKRSRIIRTEKTLWQR